MGDPATATIAASALGGPVLSALFAPEGQEISSFEGPTTLSPQATLGQAQGMVNAISQIAMSRVNQPVSLPSAVVQTPGAYTGGGLPMPIGVSSQDPALANPSLLRLSPFDPNSEIRDRTNPPRGSDEDDTPVLEFPDDPDDPNDPPESGPYGERTLRTTSPRMDSGAASSGPRRRGEGGGLVRAADLIAEDEMGGGDDLDQGMGAVQLLLESLQSGGYSPNGRAVPRGF